MRLLSSGRSGIASSLQRSAAIHVPLALHAMRSSVRIRFVLLVILIAATAITAAVLGSRVDNEGPQPLIEDRVPAEDPPVDPNRPDLFEEQGASEGHRRLG